MNNALLQHLIECFYLNNNLIQTLNEGQIDDFSDSNDDLKISKKSLRSSIEAGNIRNMLYDASEKLDKYFSLFSEIENSSLKKLIVNNNIFIDNILNPFKKLVNDLIKYNFKYKIIDNREDITHIYSITSHVDGDSPDIEDIVDACIIIFGEDVDLNWIDVSDVKSMKYLFSNGIRNKFCGNINSWNIYEKCLTFNMYNNCSIPEENFPLSVVKDNQYYVNLLLHPNTNKEGISKNELKYIADGNINFVPSTRDELYNVIYFINLHNSNNLFHDLNWIDVSNITSLTYIFNDCTYSYDISKWNVSNIENMRGLFSNSKFVGDISNWDVSNVTNMSHMFEHSQFNGDISGWDVSSVSNMSHMFEHSQFNGDISGWDVSSVSNMSYMFYNNKRFKKYSIENWDITNVKNMERMFEEASYALSLKKWIIGPNTETYHMFYCSKVLEFPSNYKRHY